MTWEFFLNITTELTDLYATAKAAGKLDLAFRILACLAKMKPEALSLDMLSVKDMTSIITECVALAPNANQDNEIEMNGKKSIAQTFLATPIRHAHTQVKVQLDPPP
jgi:hypothetical protein